MENIFNYDREVELTNDILSSCFHLLTEDKGYFEYCLKWGSSKTVVWDLTYQQAFFKYPVYREDLHMDWDNVEAVTTVGELQDIISTL